MTQATLVAVADLILAARETEVSVRVLKRHIQLVGEKGVCDAQLSALHRSGLYTDLLEAAEKGALQDADRNIFRHLLGLPSKDGDEGDFPTFMMLTLGVYQNVEALLQEMQDKGYRVSDWARDLMRQDAFTLAAEKTSIELVAPTIRELGFPEGAPASEWIVRGEELGLELCPAEVGPMLRLNYNNQPNGEWCVVAMDPITGSAGGPLLFDVRRGGGDCWLDASSAHPGICWGPGRRVVFRRRRT